MKENIFNQQLQSAVQTLQQGQFSQAEVQLRELLKLNLNQPELQHLLGVCLSLQQRYQEALPFYQQAIAIKQHPMYLYNLGECYRLLQDWASALNYLKQAQQLAPNHQKTQVALAQVYLGSAQFQQALTPLQFLLDLEPYHPNYLLQITDCFIKMGAKSAAQHYYSLLESKYPAHSALNDLSSFLKQLPSTFDKLKQHQQQLEQVSDSELSRSPQQSKLLLQLNSSESTNLPEPSKLSVQSDHLIQLAALYERNQEISRAKSLFIKLAKDKQQELHSDFIDQSFFVHSESIDAYLERFKLTLVKWKNQNFKLDFSTLHASNIRYPNSLIYQGIDDLQLRKEFAELFQDKIPEQTQALPSHKPKIAFLSTQGHTGIFFTCMKGILKQLKTDFFDIYILCPLEEWRAILAPQLQDTAIQFIPLPNRVDQAVNTIRNLKLNLLYYWEVGTDSLNYFLPFFKLAPIQCTSFGWPSTTGIQQIDYYLSSQLMLTPDTQTQHSEEAVGLEGLLTHYYRAPQPKFYRPKADYGFSESSRLYICTQNLRKLHPDFDRMTNQILERDHQGLYLLFEDRDPFYTHHLKERLKSTHPHTYSRIRFFPRLMTGPDYINLVKLADVMLDTLYWSGVNTSYDAFSVGTPIITLPGKLQRGRYTYAAYEKMRMNDCIASSEANYIEQALIVSKNSAFRQKILKQSSVLFCDLQPAQAFQNWIEQQLS